MIDILLKASGFVLIILLGYFIKQAGLAGRREADFLSRIIMNVTLPCALVTAYKQTGFDWSLAAAALIGLAGNLTTNLVGFIAGINQKPKQHACTMLNMSGYNIGTFALPFIMAFMPNAPIAYVMLFDAGNALMCLGGNYTLAALTIKPEKKVTFGRIVKALISSIPFDTYVILMIFSLLRLSIPSPVLSMASIAGLANTFLAMLMIGLMLDLKMPKASAVSIIRILAFRYLINIFLALSVFYIFPMDDSVRKMIVLCLMAPVSMASCLFSSRLHIRGPVPAAVNSISIVVSVITLTVLSMAFA